ncbi:hypothetical protein [Rhodococcus sp. 077-4]
MFEDGRDDNLIAVNPARKRSLVKASTAKAVKRDQTELVSWSVAQLGDS